MIRVFLSLPMSGRTNEEILSQIKDMESYVLESHIFGDEEIEFVHNLLSPVDEGLFDLIDNVTTRPLLYLGAAITKMATCNVVMLGRGWNSARGCIIEHDVAKKYGIPIYRCYSLEVMMRYVFT